MLECPCAVRMLYVCQLCCCSETPDQSCVVQFGLFHGDPHPGNIFALADGRIAYVDFGNVAEVSQQNKQTLIDAVVHAVNEDYEEMAKDFIKLVRKQCMAHPVTLGSSLGCRSPALLCDALMHCLQGRRGRCEAICGMSCHPPSLSMLPSAMGEAGSTEVQLPVQGFLDQGTDIRPIVPALEKIWADSMGRSLSDFNFRSVTSKFNELVFQYPIHIPERYALVIR